MDKDSAVAKDGCSQRHCSFVGRDFEGARGDLEHDGAGGAGQDGLDGC